MDPHTRGCCGPTDDAAALAAARTTAPGAWASTREGISVLDVTGSARDMSVTLVGPVANQMFDDLEAELRLTLPRSMITIQWVSGGLLVNAIPTPPQGSEVNSGTPTATKPR